MKQARGRCKIRQLDLQPRCETEKRQRFHGRGKAKTRGNINKQLTLRECNLLILL